MSFSISLSSSTLPGADPANFVVHFTDGLALPVAEGEYWTCRLSRAAIWYSWHNISSVFGNNTLRYSHDGGTSWNVVTIPNGIYQIAQLEEELHRGLMANGHYDTVTGGHYIRLVPNFATLRLRVELSNNYQIDFSNGGTSTLNELVGFGPGVITATSEGVDPVNITRGVDEIVIRCSIIRGSYDNDKGSDAIYSFNPMTGPGSLIDITPVVPEYIPVVNDTKIYEIRMRLTDQKGRLLGLNGEHVVYRLHFKKEKI